MSLRIKQEKSIQFSFLKKESNLDGKILKIRMAED
jgi:hypothetical protein